LSTKSKRKIEEAEVTAAGSQDKVMTEGSNPLTSDKIANLRTDMTRIEAAQTEMSTMLSVNTEQMRKVMKMQDTQTQAAKQTQATMNNLTCVNQMMVRLAVIEKLQAVPAEVREPQRNTAMENCDKEWKTPPKTRIVSKRTLSTEKEPQERKRSATGSSPMRSDGRFDPVLQGNLD
jgi:hypothetical protein